LLSVLKGLNILRITNYINKFNSQKYTLFFREDVVMVGVDDLKDSSEGTIDFKNMVADVQESVEQKTQNIKNVMYFNPAIVPAPDWMFLREEFKDLITIIYTFTKGMPGSESHVLVQGPNGCGKSHIPSFVFTEFKSDKEKYGDFEIIEVNCKDRHTSYAIEKAILNIKKAESASSVSKLFEDFLLSKDKPLILFLDDVQQMEDDDLLYVTSRAILDSTKGGAHSKKILVVMTSKLSALECFPNKVRTSHVDSSAHITSLNFKKYNGYELENILNLRAARGLKKYNPYLTKILCVSLIALAQGDVRIGLKSLEKIAQHDKFEEWLSLENNVGPDPDIYYKHKSVYDEFNKIVLSCKGDYQIDMITRLDDFSLVVLAHAHKYSIPFDFDKLVPNKTASYAYNVLIKTFSKFKVTKTTFFNKLDEFEKLEFIETENRRHKNSSYKVMVSNLTMPSLIALSNRLEEVSLPVELEEVQ